MPDDDCRHDWQCEGWTVDPQTSTCRVCHRALLFLSEPPDFERWDTEWLTTTVPLAE